MNPEQLSIYTEEVNIHASLALSNYATFRNIVEDFESRQRREAWMYLQSFLSHFGMVSKLLFAPSARKAISRNRARDLQSYLDIDETNSLNDRDARNAIEHLDERMDNWINFPEKGILECVFQKRSDFEFLGNRWIVRRVYLVDENIFITQEGEETKDMLLQPLVDGLNKILSITNDKFFTDNPYHMIQPSRG